MNITVKEGVRVNVKATRRIMKKRGFRFRTFKNNPLRFSVFLNDKGREMYANDIEAIMNIVFAFDLPNSKRHHYATIIQSHHGKSRI